MKVNIWLTDTRGSTVGPLQLRETGDSMERGAENPVSINLTTELLDLYKITIKHDGSGKNSDWHLDEISLTMVDPITDKTFHETPTIFNFKKWIKKSSKNRAIRIPFESFKI